MSAHALTQPLAVTTRFRWRPQPWMAVAAMPALMIAILAAVTPARSMFMDDAWYSLAAGKLIFAHGLPHHDAWTILSHGRQWVDQQWLTQVTLYSVYSAFGYGGLAVLGVLTFGGGLWLMALALRRAEMSGADGRYWPFAMAAIGYFAIGSLQLRAEMFARPLLAGVLLLALSARGRPRRLLWTLPLLVLWGNMHGSSVLGIGVVGWAALGEARRPEHRRLALGIAAAAALTFFATPYGLGVIHYFMSTALNPNFSAILEWRATSILDFPFGTTFFALAALLVVALFRMRKRVNVLDWLLFAGMLYEGQHSIRMVQWFAAIACWLVLQRRTGRAGSDRALRSSWLAAGAIIGLLAVVVTVRTGAASESTLIGSWREHLAAQVARLTPAGQPVPKIFASDSVADYLMFREPRLSGSLVYDGRQELIPTAGFHQLTGWIRTRTCAAACNPFGVSIAIVDATKQTPLAGALRHAGGWRVLADHPPHYLLAVPR